MHVRLLGLAFVTAVFLGACAPGIPALNRQPTKYYQESITFSGRISRMQELPGEVLLEVADAQEHRILVRATPPLEVTADSWVKVHGVLVPELRVGGRIVYDAVQAESVTTTSPPWLRDLY